MREFVEFRILEEFASSWIGQDGVRKGELIRKLELETTDPRMAIVAKAQRTLKADGKIFFTSWNPRRIYTSSEMDAARLLKLKVKAVFNTAGELYGTTYDEAAACPKCKAGAKQNSFLQLPINRIPRDKDFAKTLAGEVVVSERVVQLFQAHGITGVVFQPVLGKRRKCPSPSPWSQLIVQSTEAEIVAPTRTGIDVFDEDEQNEYRCPKGDLIGLNLLSEVSVNAQSLGSLDVVASRQFLGVRDGVFRPERVVFVSPKVWRLIKAEKLKGCDAEIAHEV